MLEVQGGADDNGTHDPGALALSYRQGGYRHFVRSRHNGTLGAGGNALDTADVYVGGKAEETVGKWFASRPADITDKVIKALNAQGGK